jgi:thioester reductase-like protein
MLGDPALLTTFIRVKIRGQRIELSEIEQHLATDITIKRSLVEFPQFGIYAKRLVGVVEPHLCHGRQSPQAAGPMQLLPAEVLAASGFSFDSPAKALAEKVPAYMMPTAWLVVNGIPLTDSKKVDRRKVRDWLNDLSNFDVCHTPLSPLDNAMAFDISHKVSKIIADGNLHISEALSGCNFELAAAGLDSIQVMTLAKWLYNEYGLKLPVAKLTRPRLTIEELARAVSAFQEGLEADKLLPRGVNMKREVDILSEKFSNPGGGILRHCKLDNPIATVFLTGGTGFLGIEILHQLLSADTVMVIVHVRATSSQHGRERIVAAAKRANWWSASFDSRLEVWPGDLGSAKLGLTNEQWDSLTGSASSEATVDAIIHNGAAVQWNLSYESLRASNTTSTVQLLEAMGERRSCGRFVYISGGQSLTAGTDDEDRMAANTAQLSGYAQTKIASELLVRRFAGSGNGQGHVVRVVKPSYIIGDAQRGMANQTDYLWGLTKSAIQLGTYSRDSYNSWLFVSDVVTVAKAVCKSCTTQDATPTVAKIHDGLFIRDFWDILVRDFGYQLQAVDGAEWWSSLQAQVEQSGPNHCLWPLQDLLNAGTGEIASRGTIPTAEMRAKREYMLQAIRSNILYLRDEVHFLPLLSSCHSVPAQGKVSGRLPYFRSWRIWWKSLCQLVSRRQPTSPAAPAHGSSLTVDHRT